MSVGLDPCLRAATEGDLAAVLELEHEAFASRERWSGESWRTELLADNRTVLVAETQAGPCGVISVQHLGDTADLNRVIVAAEVRRQGVGRRLIQAGIEGATELGCAEMLLEVASSNSAARAVYAELGFSEIARRSGYYGPGADALVLRKELDDD